MYYDESIIIGDDESLTLLGAEIQSEIRNTTKDIVNILLCNDNNIGIILNEMLNEIDKFQKDSNNKKYGIWGDFGTKNIIKKYINLIKYIDTIVNELQMQQVQILKSIKMLELMHQKLEKCCLDLHNSINIAEKILEKQKQDDGEEKYSNWYQRLERKLYDLKTSETVLLQSKTQIQIMCESNKKILDKIGFTLSNTIPVWRMQVSLILGIKNEIQENKVQEKLEKIIQNNIKNNTGKVKREKNKHIDYIKLEEANHIFDLEISNFQEIEKVRIVNKENLLNTVKNIGE